MGHTEDSDVLLKDFTVILETQIKLLVWFVKIIFENEAFYPGRKIMIQESWTVGKGHEIHKRLRKMRMWFKWDLDP